MSCLTLAWLLRRLLRTLEPVAQHTPQKLASKPRRRVNAARDPHRTARRPANQAQHAGFLHAQAFVLAELGDLPLQALAHFACHAGQQAVGEAVLELAPRGFLQQALQPRLAQVPQAARGQIAALQQLVHACGVHHPKAHPGGQRRAQ